MKTIVERYRLDGQGKIDRRNGPPCARAGEYECPRCGMRDESKEEHEKDGGCSRLSEEGR